MNAAPSRRVENPNPEDLDRAQALADAFGHYVQRWAEERGAAARVADLVGRAAASVSRATSAGHVCLNLRDLAQSINAEVRSIGAESGEPVTEESATLESLTAASLRAALLESRIVGSPQEPGAMPLILDGGDRLYLQRYFDYEGRLARCLLRRRGMEGARGPAGPSGARAAEILPTGVAGKEPPPMVMALLGTLFEANRQALRATADWQRIAVLTALLGNLTIISGGPGTGKTTAIVNLLACLLEENPDCRIALAAPTGKAAAAITDAIRRRAAHLPERIIGLLPQKSFTVHRLLEVLPNGGFRHDAGNPLPIDVLIVDEASMLDLALATRLIEAVPISARIILVGDKDQLAAVESGAVFAELSADPILSTARVRLLAAACAVEAEAIQAPGQAGGAGAAGDSGLTDSVVWLRKNYRFAGDSAIGRLAAEINAGDAVAALTRLRAGADSLTWIDDGAVTPSKDAQRALQCGYVHYLQALRSEVLDAGLVTAAFGRFRVLCAVRDGARGTQAVNRMLSAWFRRELEHPLDPGAPSDWYPGRPVIVLRNDYVLRLFNGDIGIVLPDAGGNLMVYFPDPDTDSDSGYRAIPPLRLPEHETAFALTVHKAQGSEFDEVLILLPAEPNRVLTRELLYTGITRARLRVIVMGSAEVVESSILTATDRVSGLMARMWEAAQGGRDACVARGTMDGPPGLA
jgi:exodeoxyribonuclease V alpha subunit